MNQLATIRSDHLTDGDKFFLLINKVPISLYDNYELLLSFTLNSKLFRKFFFHPLCLLGLPWGAIVRAYSTYRLIRHCNVSNINNKEFYTVEISCLQGIIS